VSDIIRQGRCLAKLIRSDGLIEIFDSAFRYDPMGRQVSGHDGLGRLLLCLMPRPDRAVVRGVVIDPSRAVEVGRLAYRDVASGEFGNERETDLAGREIYSPLIQFETTEGRERWRRSVLGALAAAGLSPSAEDTA
jgi:hypothetical protein